MSEAKKHGKSHGRMTDVNLDQIARALSESRELGERPQALVEIGLSLLTEVLFLREQFELLEKVKDWHDEKERDHIIAFRRLSLDFLAMERENWDLKKKIETLEAELKKKGARA